MPSVALSPDSAPWYRSTMLMEWIESLRTRCPRPWRRLGYAYAAVACAARARRCATAWAPHQQRTRAEILAVATGGRSCLVLGAGPCLDVPLAELAGRYERVILADAAIGPAMRRLAARFPNVELAAVELTGTADALAAGREPVPGCAAFLDRADIDLVLSVNLLSQLPLLPLAACTERPEEQLLALGRDIVTAHLAHLQRFACPALLITDVERRRLAPDGRVVEREDPLFGVALPPGEEWDWLLAPPGELADGHSQVTRVRAVRFPGQSRSA